MMSEKSVTMFWFFLLTMRCPDGVELVVEPARVLPAPNTIAGGAGLEPEPERVFRYRTNRREPWRLDFRNLENPVLVTYLNARDDDARAKFFSENGLLVPGEKDLASEVLQSQDSFAQLLQRIHHQRPADAVQAVNQAIATHRSFNLKPLLQARGKKSAPQILLECPSLVAFMLVEVAQIAANGARVTHCQRCRTMFLTGPLTWRRSHAKFCSDKCRVYAMRERERDRKHA
jgi:hypothetical protein